VACPQLILYQYSLDLGHYLLGGEVLAGVSPAGAGGGTDSAALAQGFIDRAYLLFLNVGDGSVGAEALAYPAAGAELFIDMGGGALNLDGAGADQGQDSGGGG